MSPALIGSLSAALCCLIVMVAISWQRGAHERTAWRRWYAERTDMIIGNYRGPQAEEAIL